MTCFKKIDGENNVFFRKVKNSEGHWNIATSKDTEDEPNVYYSADNSVLPYCLKDIKEVGFNDNEITCLYLFDDKQIGTESLKVSNPTEIQKIIDYVNNNKCNK